jgi:hypothetical protein
MSTTDHLDIGAILNVLYADEISGSITWILDVGFYVTLGSPIFAEKYADTIVEAAEWLRDQAVAYYPGSDFERKYGGEG